MKLTTRWVATAAYVTVLIAFPPYRYYAMGAWIIGHLALTTKQMRRIKHVD